VKINLGIGHIGGGSSRCGEDFGRWW